MYEVELKVPASHEEVFERLEAANATRTRRVEQVDTYYDAPHRDFAETEEALRIRKQRTLDAGEDEYGTTLTYKGPLVDDASKTRQEYEIQVSAADELEGILGGLGFEPAATVEKERTVFDLDGYTVTLDSVDGLGEFLEVERRAAEEHIEEVRTGAVDVLESLGLD
ncbi:MAG: class IV adenylate cyclase, partial [Haloferacaceae archaeon]